MPFLTTLPASDARRPQPISPRRGRKSVGNNAAQQLVETITVDAEKLQSFDEAPSVLPGNRLPTEAMKAAIARINFQKGRDEARFTRGWLASPCDKLLVAFTWHAVFSGRFPAVDAPEVADRLFSHIASAHARVFADGAIASDAHVSDALAWYLPEALSHAALYALREAYTTQVDRERFGEKLRRALFEQFVGWTSGYGGTTGRQVTTKDGHDGHQDALSHQYAGHAGLPRGSLLGARGGMRGGRGGDGSARSPRVPLYELLGAPSEAAPATAPSTDGAKGAKGAKGGGGRYVSPSKGGASGADGEEMPSPRRSMLVGPMPSPRREMRDVSASSPLMARWLKLRQLESEARGGSSAREPHRVRCSHAGGRGFEQIDQLVANGAKTFRDVRHEAAVKTRHMVTDYSDGLRSTLAETALGTMQGRIQIAAMRSEEAKVFAKGPDTMREYANYLCSMRTLMEESDEVRHAREEAAPH